MKTLLLPLLCLLCLSFDQAVTSEGVPSAQNKIKKIPISGTVTTTRSYCGGARPNDEILTQLGTPRPIGHKKIYIKEGEINSFDSKVILVLTSDAKGNFRAKLRPGKYLVVDSVKKDMTYFNSLLKTYKEQTKSYEAIDTACLKEWYLKPACVFEVSGTETKNVSVNFNIGCEEDVPCARFRGPFRQ